MGAKISVAGPPHSLYLVIGQPPVKPRVISAGGEVAMPLTEGKLLAVLSYDGFLALKGDPQIFRIGPVNLDLQRLKNLSENLAKTVAPQNNPVLVNGTPGASPTT